MRPRPAQPLRLRAAAPGHYDLLAACLQDALMSPAEMAWRPRERRFVAVFDRFAWERGRPPALMVQCALRFEGVRAARSHRVPRDDDALLELLTLAPAPGAVCMVFAGGGRIRLEGPSISAWLEDLAAPRPAPVAPDHGAETADE